MIYCIQQLSSHATLEDRTTSDEINDSYKETEQ